MAHVVFAGNDGRGDTKFTVEFGLNFSIFSKYSLYPLAYILGPMLVVIQHKIGVQKTC